MLSGFEKYPINSGRPLISSGNVIISKSGILDWVFIELDSNLAPSLREGSPLLNHLPEPDPRLIVQDDDADHDAMFKLLRTAKYFGKMTKGSWYFKLGRISVITLGKCNDNEAEINREGIRYAEDRTPYQLSGHNSTRELIILRVVKDNLGKITLIEFSRPSDLGYFVIDTSGRVCGLFHGEHTGLCGSRMDIGDGLVISVQDIQSFLASRTTFYDRKGNEYIREFVLPESILKE